jgi:phosphate/sulfate permease
MLGAAFGRALESKRDGGKDVGGSFRRGVVDEERDGPSDGSALVIGARPDGVDLADGSGSGDVPGEAGRGPLGSKRAAEVAEAESEFVRLLVLTSCVLSFSHGSQDVSNAAAPYAAVVAVAASRQLGAASSTPTWVLAAGGVGIVVGLATYGYKVMATVGTGITKLTYAKGFAAQLATALTALTATLLGLTVSTTHVMIGAIAGVALADGPDKLNFDMLKKIAASWIITLPASAALAAVGYGILTTVGLPAVP